MKNFKTVHSIQSIKKLLERQGFTDINTQRRGNKIPEKNDFVNTCKLPFLRSIKY
jgi:hypothetical protein